jgi:hypothetical protein
LLKGIENKRKEFINESSETMTTDIFPLVKTMFETHCLHKFSAKHGGKSLKVYLKENVIDGLMKRSKEGSVSLGILKLFGYDFSKYHGELIGEIKEEVLKKLFSEDSELSEHNLTVEEEVEELKKSLEEKNSKVQELLALIKKEDKLIDEH